MIRKINIILVLYLIFTGLVLLSIPVLAGTWEVEYSSSGGYHWESTYIHHLGLPYETIENMNYTDSFHSWPYSDTGGSYCKRLLPAGAASKWIDPHLGYEVDVWGFIQDAPTLNSLDFNVVTSTPIIISFRWVPNDENDLPPEKIWVKYLTGVLLCAAGRSFALSSKIINSCEDRYATYNIPDTTTEGSHEIGAYSYGIEYAELEVTSGFASVSVPLSLNMSCDGYCFGENIQMYVHADTLTEAPPFPLRKSSAPWKAGAPHCFFDSVFDPTFNPRIGGTQSGGDPVDLATGSHLYLPDSDITSYNPYGLNAAYQRNYISLRAESGYASPGLSAGWVDNYDVKIVTSFSESADRIYLVYPNGAEDTFYYNEGISVCRASGTAIPMQIKYGCNNKKSITFSAEDPSIELRAPNGASYFITSIPSQTPNRWDSITLTFKDQTQWTFTTEDGYTYYLSRISNMMGRYISIIRDVNNGNRLTSITDDSSPANVLLNFHYNSNKLSYISDAYGRKVTYTFGQSANTTCLLSISQITALNAENPSMLEQYGYESIDGKPHITTISSPNPTGSGQRIETINYDNSTQRVTSLVDANGNQSIFTYDGYNGKTKIQIKNPQNIVVKEWTERFDPSNGNIRKGTADANGRGSTLLYEDYRNTGLLTTILDREGKRTEITYDQFGNILTLQDPRGTTTTYNYDYSGDEFPSEFPFGRLMNMQHGSKPPTSFTYYEPSGLIHTITSPKPGTTGGTETVTTTFTYDDIGNILTKVVPGNPADQTTTYNYMQDGTYTQPAKLGQPLTMTDNLGHITHFRYDERGNTSCVIDALGNRTDFSYNLANQLVTTVNP